MHSRFFRPRTIWWPTWPVWIFALFLLLVPFVTWWFAAEPFLAATERRGTNALILEGWIGIDGVRAAHDEYLRGGYSYIITAGGMTENRWGSQRWNYANEAHDLLVRLGVPSDRVISAPAADTAAHRTFAAATAVRRTLAKRTMTLKQANVLTLGVHARRSRLVFAKVLPDVEVGVISWRPTAYAPGPWWESSERAEDLLKETVGYLFELLLNSGRLTNLPPDRETAAAPASAK